MQTRVAKSKARRLLILQGPVGRFFHALASRAAADGYDVTKVQFNLADEVLQAGGTVLRYTEPMDNFRAWLDRLCREQRPDTILVFGDRRPVHIDACAVAETLGIKLYALEEGYLRPNFVTFEAGGNNARSPLTRAPDEIRAFAAVPRPIVHIEPSFIAMTLDAILYYVLMSFGQLRYPHYRHHRARTLWSETKYWLRNTYRRVMATLPDNQLQASLIAQHSRRYFVVALQVHDDLQAIHHGRGWTQERFIETTITSFAAHAPSDMSLVLRCHPYDRGHTSYGPLIKALALAHGLADRVQFLQTGHGPSLLASARGFVTVNSTMALSAMYHRCPVFALGDTFYHVPGLVADGSDEAALAKFWHDPGTVDHELYVAFLNLLREKALINGSFYRSQHWEPMIAKILTRVDADCCAAKVAAKP